MPGFTNIGRILMIKLRHIGDTLLAVPAIRAVRETYPKAYIAALVNSGTEETLTGNPLINEVLTFQRSNLNLPMLKRLKNEFSFFRKLRSMRFDMTVDLTGGDRAAIISFISGARYRLGYSVKGGFWGKRYIYTHIAKKNRKQHTVLRNLDVVKQLGIDTDNLKVDFYIPEEARAFVSKVLRDNGVTSEDFVVHIHPTSRWLFKCWEADSMAEVINYFLSQGLKVVVTSGPDKKELNRAQKILSMVRGNVINLCGKTTIKQLGAVSEAANLFFGIDSAPMHIAAAVETPVIALFGPSGAYAWGPWDKNVDIQQYFSKNGNRSFGMHRVIQKEWDCIPCGKDGCNGSKESNCLKEIKPEEVIKAISWHLSSKGT
ncbi:MAG TPA: putative lipopolysaccharide heptosyltransferase III [Candidatus Omnitrophica bacterium]|nr:putative lipopolysaccharide heptosyltransferase III [Candidatus Omnitrophota bacterium]